MVGLSTVWLHLKRILSGILPQSLGLENSI
jgi:hypothetical protein